MPHCLKFHVAKPIMMLMAAAGLVVLAAPSASAADAANGERLAQRWCASCHVVAEGQRAGTPDVPTFAAIGKKPDYDPVKIANFLMSPHPVMPNMSLTRIEAGDLAAYIKSQGK